MVYYITETLLAQRVLKLFLGLYVLSLRGAQGGPGDICWQAHRGFPTEKLYLGSRRAKLLWSSKGLPTRSLCGFCLQAQNRQKSCRTYMGKTALCPAWTNPIGAHVGLVWVCPYPHMPTVNSHFLPKWAHTSMFAGKKKQEAMVNGLF